MKDWTKTYGAFATPRVRTLDCGAEYHIYSCITLSREAEADIRRERAAVHAEQGCKVCAVAVVE